MVDHKQKALDYFSQKLHCSQSVLAAFADECGITEEQALKLGSCLVVACARVRYAMQLPER